MKIKDLFKKKKKNVDVCSCCGIDCGEEVNEVSVEEEMKTLILELVQKLPYQYLEELKEEVEKEMYTRQTTLAEELYDGNREEN